ncbi:putative glycosyltransferase family 4 protein [Monocercomonoides exilis]|uniref:putative glycosyltransferase family 4 protein n=1 Tax=Monocercomonoides exilis TaxID=2049356 RepID=UPI00355A92BD|nr:putative glycosyltransferase family 4 protein [Monocercomonoides exilis]|eukprot:MONOS_8638.1-p1 / transcript=MONOS_8638.1 / gene=MONOS_8638 / organism=Monocercomonoides_exilis_PA203 / gene_product=glycosyltransferase family 4 protein / transcript_product=glycosyltransferase family 4 protein / location=Mono_scaffold00330:51182-53528(+) / protein_length=612 / sequence_SO=supercontig / SO=protein_coding / is_pseudo=false
MVRLIFTVTSVVLALVLAFIVAMTLKSDLSHFFVMPFILLVFGIFTRIWMFIISLEVSIIKSKRQNEIIAFLHPNVDQFGGGEKVFWQLLDVAAGEAKAKKNTEIIIFCAPSPKFKDFDSLLKHAQITFAYSFENLTGSVPIRLYPVPFLRTVYNSRSWPCTLLSMAFTAYFGGIMCSLECPPDILIETSGYPLAYISLKSLTKCKIGAYIHYPFAYCLERQMRKHINPNEVPSKQKSGLKGLIASTKTKLRIIYYHLVQNLYYSSLKVCDIMWVNSSWTKARHVETIHEVENRKGLTNNDSFVSLSENLTVLYPPCDSLQFIQQLVKKWNSNKYSVAALPSSANVKEKSSSSSSSSASVESDALAFAQSRFIAENWFPPPFADNRLPQIVSVGQFRPEKEHEKQVAIFSALYKKHPELKPKKAGEQGSEETANGVKLIMCGGLVKGMEWYVDNLKKEIEKEGLQDAIELRFNVPGEELRETLMNSMGAIHTMFEEHFGIVIVEMMASGAVPIVNPSGGMFDDVFDPAIKHTIKPGFTAVTPDEYADRIYNLYSLWNDFYHGSLSTYRDLQIACYSESLRFSIESFRDISTKQVRSFLASKEEGKASKQKAK